MILGSKLHTAGNSTRWRVDYSYWLDNTATIVDASVASSSPTCQVSESVILGSVVTFFLIDGVVGETLTVNIVMTDSLGNIKRDTIMFTVVAP
jgi:hypothetical protein